MELSFSLWKPQQEPQNPDHPHDKIVMLHGMGGTGALWRPIAASLEETYEILAPDQRGHGKSRVTSVPGGRTEVDYTPLAYGQDVIDTMESQGFHPTWLIGHSMGVRTACAAAHLRPEWVRGLVLIDLGFSGAAGGGLGEGLASFLKVLPKDFASRVEARDFMKANCPDPSIAQYLMAVSYYHEDRLIFPFDHAALIQTIRAARDASVRQWVTALAQRRMKILVLRGAKSLVWTHNEFMAEKEQFKAFPSVEFREVEGAGHGLPFEKREEFVGILREFFLEKPDRGRNS